MEIDRALAECFLRLNGPEFKALKDWIESKREVERDACGRLEGTMMYRAQGRQSVFNELRERINTAREVIDKFPRVVTRVADR